MTSLKAIDVDFLPSPHFNELLAVVNSLEIVVGVQRLGGLPPIRLDSRVRVSRGADVGLRGRSSAVFD